MKKLPYIEPEIDIVQLCAADIIITSGDNVIEDNWEVDDENGGFF